MGQATHIPTLDEALTLSRKQVRDMYSARINPGLCGLLSLIGFDRRFVEARGTVLTDEDGQEYLDFLAGYGSVSLGHNNPEVLEAIRRVDRAPNILQASLGLLAAPLAEALAALSPGALEKVFFGNSGTEAVEGALKVARAATGRRGFLSADQGFHGKTLGSLSVSGRDKYRRPFEPLIPGCVRVPFGDVASLSRELETEQYACYIVEPIQGEGGIVVPPEGYLAEAQRLCRETGTLLIVDEIQTGFGRTGYLWGCDVDGVEPDLMVVAKALGGGVVPIGAYLSTEGPWKKVYGTRDTCTLHTSTFGANTRACAAGLKSIEIVLRDDLAQRARRLGSRMLGELQRIAEGSSLIKEVRGRGLLIGVEMYEPRVARGISHEFLAASIAGLLLQEHGILTAYTLNNPNVIRFEPPLTVSEAEIDRAVEAFEQTVRRHGGLVSALAGVGRRFVRNKIG